MSQPYDRGAKIPVPGKIDSSLGEFWAENPWEIIHKGHNLSAYERHRAYWNVGGKDFLEMSYLTGTDHDGDARSVVACDFRNQGRLDLLVRGVGGGPVRLYENRFPRRHYLKVSLRGSGPNRLGIGARVTATVAGKQIVRDMFPVNTYRSQMPSLLHFGLGNSQSVEKLVVRWPSGKVQELRDLAGDRHIVIDEQGGGPNAIETVRPGMRYRP